MDAKQRLYSLYVSYFDQNAENYEKANRFVTSVGAEWLKIEKLDEHEFFGYLQGPVINEALRIAWLNRILDIDRTGKTRSLLGDLFSSASSVARPHFLAKPAERSTQHKE
ncbi:MAG: hypothetical protein O3C40_08665 [Planctomycetota bacterium]|nr:hypothetical protein [Planctomycetota bacterium]